MLPRRVRRFLPLLVVPLALAGPPAGATTGATTGVRDCAVIPVAAHRGAHDARHAEDTPRSFLRAAHLAADVVEGDLHLTGDGHWVLLHDDTVDRTTDGRGAIERLTLAQARALRTGDGHHGLVTLARLLVTLRAHPTTHLQLEIKPYAVSAHHLRMLLSTLDAEQVGARALLTSYDGGNLRRVRAIGARWHTGLLTHSPHPDVRTVRREAQVIIAHAPGIDRAFVRRAHRAGLAVYPWDVDTRDRWRRVVRARVDQLITDDVREVRGWCAAAHS